MVEEGRDDPLEVSMTSSSRSEALSEARRTMSRQAEVFDDVQRKALKLMQYTATLASLLGTGVGIVAETNAVNSYGTLVNPYTVAGIVLLGVAGIVAGFAYTLSIQISGLGPTGIREGLEEDKDAYKDRLVRGYAEWIEQNRMLTHRADALVSLAILVVAGALLSFGMGMVDTFLVRLPVWAAGVGVVVWLAIGYLSGVGHRLYHLTTGYDGGALNPVLDGRKNGSLPHSTSRTRERLKELQQEN